MNRSMWMGIVCAALCGTAFGATSVVVDSGSRELAASENTSGYTFDIRDGATLRLPATQGDFDIQFYMIATNGTDTIDCSAVTGDRALHEWRPRPQRQHTCRQGQGQRRRGVRCRVCGVQLFRLALHLTAAGKWIGEIQGEILLYSTTLTDDVRNGISTYLMGKWLGFLPEGYSDSGKLYLDVHPNGAMIIFK